MQIEKIALQHVLLMFTDRLATKLRFVASNAIAAVVKGELHTKTEDKSHEFVLDLVSRLKCIKKLATLQLLES